MTGTDDALAAIGPKHEPVNVTDAMRQANEPAPGRITRPANDHAVERIAQRTTRPAEDGGAPS